MSVAVSAYPSEVEMGGITIICISDKINLYILPLHLDIGRENKKIIGYNLYQLYCATRVQVARYLISFRIFSSGRMININNSRM